MLEVILQLVWTVFVFTCIGFTVTTFALRWLNRD